MKRHIAALGAVIAVLGAGDAPAAAHSVTQLVYRVAFPFSGTLVKAVDEAWTLDEGTSAQIFKTYDRNGDGTFDKAESMAAGADIMGNLASSGYLTAIRVGGRSPGVLKPFGFRAYASGPIVIIAFGLRLPQPVDPARTPLTVTVRDPDFVMDVEPAQDKLAIVKDAPAKGCAAAIAPGPAGSYPRFAVAPQVITLSCRAQ
ncbi:ABC-type uncharacterized transport system substrate-binding protein [Breoghania corrubedonensis]|uniref:ABC-type uncharacterized transport system substrate-binding protein n=1 Tax=Breoghania corrubedonensis TaxID=665038 RepID=A0A2T5V515_9HYPH|nr:DUF1007 family protein [Breoghania corrubedonensis]PTW58838.1 ABC-type uncharacterized transport system substrate-binding protein [Breoghania corrubedonensis]